MTKKTKNSATKKVTTIYMFFTRFKGVKAVIVLEFLLLLFLRFFNSSLGRIVLYTVFLGFSPPPNPGQNPGQKSDQNSGKNLINNSSDKLTESSPENRLTTSKKPP